jgi:serine protease inhibitor
MELEQTMSPLLWLSDSDSPVYFKGDWDRQFKKNLTRSQTFYLSAE